MARLNLKQMEARDVEWEAPQGREGERGQPERCGGASNSPEVPRVSATDPAHDVIDAPCPNSRIRLSKGAGTGFGAREVSADGPCRA